MRKLLILPLLVLTFSACLQGGTIQNREACTQYTVDQLVPPKHLVLKTFIPWQQNFQKNLNAAPARVVHCWYPGTELASSDPSTPPTIIKASELPADARPAPWVDMPGYIVYYVVLPDGSGYAYFAVANPPKETVK